MLETIQYFLHQLIVTTICDTTHSFFKVWNTSSNVDTQWRMVCFKSSRSRRNHCTILLAYNSYYKILNFGCVWPSLGLYSQRCISSKIYKEILQTRNLLTPLTQKFLCNYYAFMQLLTRCTKVVILNLFENF